MQFPARRDVHSICYMLLCELFNPVLAKESYRKPQVQLSVSRNVESASNCYEVFKSLQHDLLSWVAFLNIL